MRLKRLLDSLMGVAPEEPKRARNDEGKFIADDPATPENEAWEGGVSPSKTKNRKKKF